MAGKTRTESTFVELKLQRRWEQRYPDLRCVMAPDPEKFRTPEARQAIGRLQKQGYRPLPLTDEEKFDLMDRDDHVLMGCPLDRYRRNLEDQRAQSFVPDKTDDVIG